MPLEVVGAINYLDSDGGFLVVERVHSPAKYLDLLLNATFLCASGDKWTYSASI